MLENVVALAIGAVVGYLWRELHKYCGKRRSSKRAQKMMSYMESGPYAMAVKIPDYASEGAKAHFVVGGIYPKAMLDDNYVENLECNGQMYDPDAYPQIHSILQDRFGVNRIPDYRGRIIR